MIYTDSTGARSQVVAKNDSKMVIINLPPPIVPIQSLASGKSTTVLGGMAQMAP